MGGAADHVGLGRFSTCTGQTAPITHVCKWQVQPALAPGPALPRFTPRDCTMWCILFSLPGPASGGHSAHQGSSLPSFPAPRAASLLLVPSHRHHLPSRPAVGKRKGVLVIRGSGGGTAGVQHPSHISCRALDASAPPAPQLGCPHGTGGTRDGFGACVTARGSHSPALSV